MTKPTLEQILAAQAAGHDAAVQGHGPGTNPYRLSDILDQDHEEIQALQIAWIREYQHTRAEVEARRDLQTKERR